MRLKNDKLCKFTEKEINIIINYATKTKSGIELSEIKNTWICFCEMKWYSDISIKISNDLQRNQLLRVIENALCFQKNKKFVEKIYVTLVIPAVFKQETNDFIKSRLYHYKFEEYTNCIGIDNILKELEACKKLGKRNQNNWVYLDENTLKKQINVLSLYCITYEELFEQLPDSPLSQLLKEFWNKYKIKK